MNPFNSFGLMCQSFDCDWRAEAAVASDYLQDQGFKYEELGPGIVKRSAGRWLTLRPGYKSTVAQHLYLRGLYDTDFGLERVISLPALDRSGRLFDVPNPYSQEDLGNL